MRKSEVSNARHMVMQKLMRKSEVSTAHGHAETLEEIRGKQCLEFGSISE